MTDNERFMPDASTKERLEIMRNTAVRVERRDYQVPLTDEELAAVKDQFSSNSIFIESEKDKLKDVVDAHKALIKPKVEENKVHMDELKTKQRTVTGELFEMVNHEKGTMDYYDADGELIERRKLRPDERKSMNIFAGGFAGSSSKMFTVTGTEG